jgi:tRNA-dihydrouridine synthase
MPHPRRAALEQSGADAVMLGRGVYGRPWIAAALEPRSVYG